MTSVLTKSVCVMGAGVAGLCALRHFTARLDQFGPVVCYEQMPLVGGTWNYTDKVGFEDNGLPVHTSMYRGLRTNAPSQIMEFPDFGWHYTKSYPDQSEVLEFIHDYADHFNLLPYINFEHHIKAVTRTENCWKLNIWNIRSNQTLIQKFDVLILCPGRNFIPMIPQEIESKIKQFSGTIIHSHDYRDREAFAGQRVAVIGAGPSGFDICQQVSTVARDVFFINRTNVQYDKLPQNIHQIQGQVEEFESNSIVVRFQKSDLKEFISIDSVILATGYRIYLDFVDQSVCGLRLNADDTLDGIYRHFINIQYPTMALLSIARPSHPFQLYHQQILYYIKLLLGEIPMPSEQNMINEVKDELIQRRTLGYRDADKHLFKVDSMREYLNKLETDGALEPTPPVLFDLYEEVARVRQRDPVGYKSINYRLVDEKNFVVV